MAIAFRAVGAAKKNTGSGNMASVALPAGHALNDILICKVMAADNIVCTMPAGWVRKLGANNGINTRYEEWWKRDGGAEAAPTVTHAAGNSAQAWIEAYSGVDSGLADPYRDAQTGTGTGAASGNFTLTMPALTGVVSGDYLLATPSYGAGATDGTPAYSTPTGFTSRVAVTSNVAGTKDATGAAFTLLASGSAGSITSTAAWNGTGAPAWMGAQSALSSDSSVTTQQAIISPWVMSNKQTGPQALRYNYKEQVIPWFVDGGAAVVNASITQVAGTVTATGGTQVVASVQNSSITQVNGVVTASGGTQVVATVNNVAITQVAGVVTAGGGTQVIATTNFGAVTQLAGTVTAGGGTQVITTVNNVAITQVAATVTVGGGTQVISTVNNVSITQVAGVVTVGGGTQSLGSIISCSITQVAGTVTASGGTQVVATSNFVALSQLAGTVTTGGGSQSIATVNNANIYQTSAVHFDGVNGTGSGTIAAASSATSSSPITLAIWFQLGADGTATAGSNTLISYRYWYIHVRNSTNQPQVRFDETVAHVTTGAVLGAGNRGWHLVIGRYTPTGGTNWTMDFFQDGVKTTSSGTVLPTTLIKSGGYDLGLRGSAFANVNLNRAIIYNRSITDQEAADLWNLNTVPASPEGLYELNQGSGSTIVDSSAHSQTSGTLVNGYSWVNGNGFIPSATVTATGGTQVASIGTSSSSSAIAQIGASVTAGGGTQRVRSRHPWEVDNTNNWQINSSNSWETGNSNNWNSNNNNGWEVDNHSNWQN